MLTSLRVTGFRNLSSLSMEGLTRVTLLVGENNAGKTSVLEAAEILLLSGVLPLSLILGPLRRGENVPPSPDEERGAQEEVDLGNLFHGRDTSPSNSFELHGESSEGPFSVSCAIEARKIGGSATSVERLALYVALTTTSDADAFQCPIRISGSNLNREAKSFRSAAGELKSQILQFVATAAPPMDALGELWDGIVLTPEEAKVVEAIQIIQPDIERLAWLSRSRRGSGGIFVKLQELDRPAPLGSMGEGIKRLLVLAMNLVSIRYSADEILNAAQRQVGGAVVPPPPKNSPYRLLVEGLDDQHAVTHLMKRHGFDWDDLKDHAKGRIHTWLAWQEKPGLTFGTALTARLLGHDSPEALRFVAWFHRLFTAE